jgi:hypothetical protein
MPHSSHLLYLTRLLTADGNRLLSQTYPNLVPLSVSPLVPLEETNKQLDRLDMMRRGPTADSPEDRNRIVIFKEDPYLWRSKAYMILVNESSVRTRPS